MRAIRALIILVIVGVVGLAFYPTIRRTVERLYYPLEYTELIRKAAVDHELDPFLISAVIFEESKFDPAVKSKAGAVGLMQVMPETGRWVCSKRGRDFKQEDLVKPETNIDIGCWYLHYLKDKYRDEDLALAAYNGGIENVDSWLKDGATPATTVKNIPFKETREFVARVNESRAKYQELYQNELK